MQKPDYFIGFENGDISPYAHIQNENMECEVEPGEVSLKSFKVKDYLENHIWNDDGTLDSRVRLSLLHIADDFWETCNIRWVKPISIRLTGSICNYNWSEYSDVDLHIVVDFSDIHKNKDFVQEYFDDKKNEWNNEHDNLHIYGFPVEVYVEDVSASTVSLGVYDVTKNEWVKRPDSSKIRPIKLNKYAIKQVAADLMTDIDCLVDAFDKEDDKQKIKKIGSESDDVLNKIKSYRKSGLKDGEMGSGNIVYKCIRRSGYLDKLWDLRRDIYDKLNSIEDNKSFKDRIKLKF